MGLSPIPPRLKQLTRAGWPRPQVHDIVRLARTSWQALAHVFVILVLLPRRAARASWLGPHFYYDVIRLARKGWPTFARVFYLVVLLISLTVMYRTQGNTLAPHQLSEYARYAHNYAYTLIVLQDILVLVLLPVYVASAVAEEKENQTLEALTLTHLTDRELVLGKFGARILHLGAVVLSAFPLLIFMRLWGNVDVLLLAYHEINTLLLLLSAGSVCILVSAYSESVFQAISRSYPWLALLGLFGVVGALALPWLAGNFFNALKGARGQVIPLYLAALPLIVFAHGGLTALALYEAVRRMEALRREEQRGLRKNTAALALADDAPPQRAPGKRGQVRSRIHPWAWPIGDDAVFWKECIKDGTRWSLSSRWVLKGLFAIVVGAYLFHSLHALATPSGRLFLRSNAYSWSLTAYFVGLAAYALVVLFQMTMAVAGEREQNTLTFLLQIPDDRRAILRAKWLGPWWRNWPILAVSYLGVCFGLACGIFRPTTTLVLLILPWPTLLMLGGLALWLSVVCRRVLFANLLIVGILGILFIAHVAAARQSWVMLSFFISVIWQTPLENVLAAADRLTWEQAASLALGEQALFALIGILTGLVASRRFTDRNYAVA